MSEEILKKALEEEKISAENLNKVSGGGEEDGSPFGKMRICKDCGSAYFPDEKCCPNCGSKRYK